MCGVGIKKKICRFYAEGYEKIRRENNMRTILERNEEYFKTAKEKTSRKLHQLFVLSLFGGIFSAFGSIGFAFGQFYSGSRLVGALIFPMGIILTTLAGADVFMGNALISMPVLSGEVKLSKFLKTHALVFVGNFIGAFLIASLTAASGVLGGGIAESVISTAVAKAELAPYQSIIRGILCNMLVTLGVWSAVVAKSAAGKFMALYFPIVVFVSAGFENAITNVYFLTSGAFASAMYNGSSELGVILLGFAKNLIPVAIGNMIGGMAIGALYRIAYVEKNKNREKDNQDLHNYTIKEEQPSRKIR